MSDSYDLSKLGPEAFENIVNFLALHTLGLGSSGFGPGADNGRDGFFEGEAPYPSATEHWKGVWYIQSKFHKPHLSTNPQKWLIQQAAAEIKAFDENPGDREWPTNWILATNIDPSGRAETGSFDAIRKLLKKSPGGQRVNFNIWGGRKILDLLELHDEVARHYQHLLTPGHVISALYEDLTQQRASLEDIIRYFVATQFSDHAFTKLDQAGSKSDVRPGIHDLFIDLPYRMSTDTQRRFVLADLLLASAQSHRYSLRKVFPDAWKEWSRQFRRARVSLIKGGPGQGKSTVGQYFCQIQRACLILAADGPRVTDAVRSHATDVSSAACKMEFWPTSPRIPIQIELKEYAHWCSQLKPSDPSNVLSYIAATVARKIGSSVPPKTIKNALSKRNWVVVFDGLDEVPNDSKDAVAKEVMYFLNDVLIDIDGDVLSLCTSRPQGYSGQFHGLDGPVVDLEQLDPRTAMNCARPLLKFGRNSDDAEKSIAILENAIASENIRQLMTTPLQSHIMAIIVRDGGRPPERRWKLFNGFYEVMKKRENMKNFRDEKIARLLGEDDRLLKSVHMRLGFVLHARAERSDGAQTTLNRSEFRHLVQAAVVDLVEHDIDATIDSVMEATTERLVLISTPENGESVRFDIRQLQEFFAAEFLHTRVAPGELEFRIDTIGGDSHWREVMHFLLSALIENQRTTDVAVSVQVLRKLNEGSEAGSSLYHRRMARAGLLAARLLLEGVLEQDQKDRQQLKPLFDPLFGLLDIDALEDLSQLRPAHSRQWFLHLLIQKIRDANPREYVGALYLLGWLLPDHHGESNTISLAFRGAPIGFQRTLWNSWSRVIDARLGRHLAQETIPQRRVLSNWVIEEALHTLNSRRWLDFDRRAISSVLDVIRSDSDQFIAVANRELRSKDLAEAAKVCFQPVGRSRGESSTNKESNIDCGLVTATPFAEDWSNGKTPGRFASIDAKSRAQEANGALRLLLTCVWFGKCHDLEALRTLLDMVDSAGTDRISALPQEILALVPLNGPFTRAPYNTSWLRKCDSITYDEIILRAKTIPIQRQSVQILVKPRKQRSEAHWRALTTSLPMIAIDLAFRSEEFPDTGPPAFIPELVELVECETIAASQHILKWGYLIPRAPQLLASLRVQVCAQPVDWVSFWRNPNDEILSFQLALPAEAPLLQVLAPALVSWQTEEQQMRSMGHGNPAKKSFNMILGEYGLNDRILREIAESSIHAKATRAGALSLYWLSFIESANDSGVDGQVRQRLDISREQDLYSQLADSSNETWLTAALIRSVLMVNTENDAGARDFVTYLMERCLDGEGPRDELIELIGNWRERSSAPVQSRQVMEKWLNYTF